MPSSLGWRYCIKKDNRVSILHCSLASRAREDEANKLDRTPAHLSFNMMLSYMFVVATVVVFVVVVVASAGGV